MLISLSTLTGLEVHTNQCELNDIKVFYMHCLYVPKWVYTIDAKFSQPDRELHLVASCIDS